MKNKALANILTMQGAPYGAILDYLDQDLRMPTVPGFWAYLKSENSSYDSQNRWEGLSRPLPHHATIEFTGEGFAGMIKHVK